MNLRNLTLIIWFIHTSITYARLIESQLVVLPNKFDYKSAIKSCDAQGMKLIRIEDYQTNEMVYKFAVNRKLGNYWIEGDDESTEGQWLYNDRKKMTYTNWDLFEPNNLLNEDCIQVLINKKGVWNDYNCIGISTVICYKDLTTTTTTIISTIKRKSISLYMTYEKITYDKAVEFCNNDNLRLIRIDNVEINRAIYNMATRKAIGTYWIDGIYNKANGTWIDSNGNPIKYRNFKSDHFEIIDNKVCIQGMFYGNEIWNNVPCESINSVICMDNE